MIFHPPPPPPPIFKIGTVYSVAKFKNYVLRKLFSFFFFFMFYRKVYFFSRLVFLFTHMEITSNLHR